MLNPELLKLNIGIYIILQTTKMTSHKIVHIFIYLSNGYMRIVGFPSPLDSLIENCGKCKCET